MRIVIVSKDEGLKVAGIGIFTQRLRKFLSKSGDSVFELRFSKKRLPEKEVFPIPYLLAEKRTFVILPSLKSLKTIEKRLRQIRPDIVYLNIGTSTLDFVLPRLCHKLGIPIAAVWHGDFANSSKSLKLLTRLPFLAYIPFCKQLDLLHVFSKNLKDFYVKKGVPAEKILVLPNGVDTDIYCPGPSKFAKEKGIRLGILFLGRLTVVKNPGAILQSFLELSLPDGCKLVVVGYGELFSKLRKRYKDKQIIFTGAITEETEKIDVIRACQVFVLPSRYEGMSLSLLEAMGCGLAAVATDVGTNRQLIDGAGKIIPYSELGKRLTPILQNLINNHGELVKLGRKARKRMVENYSERRILAKLREALYKTVTVTDRHWE